MNIASIVPAPAHAGSVIKPYVLSHGTLECYDIEKSRRFYEEFLGLECVHHASRGLSIRCGVKFHIVCLEVGERLKPVSVFNHWGLDVATPAQVDAAWEAAKTLQQKYEIRQVLSVKSQHGVYSFYLEDLDHNWWEIQHYDGFQHDDVFAAGDRHSMADRPSQRRLRQGLGAGRAD
ncbi:VOC family protein [Pigmentiphaga kullae]|uniref:Catechol 2,3-dioxygenase-like lactoylglutathione lyase family enzyme n=1 Tax=Pigmentiphaga kullae TaxID=151784 RepID=A0A4Q7NK57_9BURK|nr:VOC family protein [Pigmentiphaga kullae]RZS85465.1 catechol 2,3-dioxygenase-like lactoylglutathione lyase family enzyme [Pigmentiphaga kullae]